jgi:hypothetical protein
MGGARKIAVTLLAAVCAALALSACGGGDDTTTAPAVELGTSGNSEGGNGEGGSESKSGGGGEGKPSNNGGGNQEEPEEEESSGGDERSASFRTPGGDNSIQNYGGEGDAGERAKATKTITLFFKSSENEEWATVCGLLSSKNLSALKQFSEKMKTLNGKGCPEVLALVMTKAPGKPPEEIKGGVVSLRVKGNISFALYHGIDGKNYAFPLQLEDAEWKLTGLAPTPLSF